MSQFPTGPLADTDIIIISDNKIRIKLRKACKTFILVHSTCSINITSYYYVFYFPINSVLLDSINADHLLMINFSSKLFI